MENRSYWDKILGRKPSPTYAEAVNSLRRIEESISKIKTSITNVDATDFNVVKNQWTDLPADISERVSVMGLHLGDDYISLLGYYTPNATVKPHQHKNEWEVIKILEGEAYDKTNNIKLTKGDVYIIPRNKIHNIVTKDSECYLYALFTSDKKYLKIPHTESDAAAKKYIHDINDTELKHVNVLYIDDEQANLNSFKAAYRREPFTVYTAKTLEEAKYILERTKIHVLFCDYRMPEYTGTEVIKEIRAEFPGVVPVAVTAFYNEEILKELRDEAGVTTCICKPWNHEEIIEAVKYSYNIHRKFGE